MKDKARPRNCQGFEETKEIQQLTDKVPWIEAQHKKEITMEIRGICGQ